jgi:hypothetical protein
MIRQIDIYTMAGVLVEQIMDYHVLQGILYSHDNGHDVQVQDGEFKVRALTEMYCRNDQNPHPFVNPSQPPNTTYDPALTYQDGTAHSFQTQKVMLPIRLSALIGSGGRNNNRVIPLSALGGLRVRFTLREATGFTGLHEQDVLKECKLADWFYAIQTAPDVNVKLFKITAGFNDVIDTGANTASGNPCFIAADIYTPDELAAEITSAMSDPDNYGADVTASFNPAFTTVTLANDTANPITCDGNFFNYFAFDAPALPPTSTPQFPIAAGGNGVFTLCLEGDANSSFHNSLGTAPFRNVPVNWDTPFNGNPYDLNTQPFLAKQSIRAIATTGGSNYNLGQVDYINSVAIDAAKPIINPGSTSGLDSLPAFIRLRLVNPFDPTTMGTDKVIQAGQPLESNVNNGIQYTLNNVSMDVTVITPPPAYISSMMSAIQSGDGLDFPINVFETLRTNIVQGETITQQNLPYINTKARSILSCPTKPGVTTVDTYDGCNLLRPLHMTKFFYTYGGVRHPSLGCDTTRLESGLVASPYAPSLSQELINSQIQAFEYSLSPLRSLNAYDDGYKTKVFFVGRNLGTLNSTYNVQNQNLSLTIEATGGTAISATLTMNHYLYAENILKITPSGVEVFR